MFVRPTPLLSKKSTNMNIRLVQTKFLLSFGLLWLTLTGLHAQGFVQQYPYSTFIGGSTQSVFPQADGSFRLTAASYPDLPNSGTQAVNLLRMNCDAQGALTSTTTTPFFSDTFPRLFLLENGGYLSATADSNNNTVSVRHFTANHSLVWSNDVTFPNFQIARPWAILANDDGEVFVRGYTWSPPLTVDIDSGFVMKFSPQGALLWNQGYHTEVSSNGELYRDLETTPDGGCVFINTSFLITGTNPFAKEVLRFNSDGSLQWQYVPANGSVAPNIFKHSVGVNALGETLIPVYYFNATTGLTTLQLDKVGPNAQLLDQTDLSAAAGLPDLQIDFVIPTADGGWVMSGYTYVAPNISHHIVRLSASGDVVWHKPLSFFDGPSGLRYSDGRELSDGSLVLYGYQGYPLHKAFLIKLSPRGTIYPHTVVGQVARDITFDCLPGPSDPPLQNWIITAEGNGYTQYTTTDATGHYAIPDLDTGSYAIKISPASYLWNVCTDSVPVQFSGALPQTDTVDFQVQSLYDCPLMQVDMSTRGLRRCFSETYVVNYCNAGTQAAEPATLSITLDPLLQVDSASIPFTQTGGLLHFALGTVPFNTFGSFRLYVSVSCDAELEQTLCAEAHIFPDTLCAPGPVNWSGAIIEVAATCLGDSVLLTIGNTGNAATSQNLDFIVIDDHVITKSGQYNLAPGEIHYEKAPADGSTWRLVAQQEPGFPLGLRMPSVAVEGCDAIGSGFTTGMLNMFSNYSGNPFHAMNCLVVVGSYDPNDKQAFPVGADNQHLIEPNTPLDYQIRFQNTGTDTAFTVVVKDTLASWLDPTTIRPGAASHPYTWTLSGAGILTFRFDNILLPDSNVNEVTSHGFVKFYIDQRKAVPLGTVLENRAGIYFDFNAPVMTNTVWHTVGHDFLPTATREPGLDLPSLQIWPNPASQSASVWAEKTFQPGQQLVLRDMTGRVLWETAVRGQTVEVQRAGLPAGLYFIELHNPQGIIAVGKVVWE